MSNKLKILIVLCVTSLMDVATGHGMVMDPVNRASRWRVDGSHPRDYTDNGLNCGGFNNQWITYKGKCGMCGDDYADSTPRNHENGGKFGQGVIVKTYNQGQMMDVTVKITANHKGHFNFKICNLDHEKESEGCFEKFRLKTGKGEFNYKLPSTENKDFKLKLKLPALLTCKQCVLQWTYVAGNNWGHCEDGTGKVGCGPQEHFRNCADISIKGKKKTMITKAQKTKQTSPSFMKYDINFHKKMKRE